MEGVAGSFGEDIASAVIQLHIVGPLRAATTISPDVLPPLRKARAMFVLLALTDGQNMPRRHLAGLLWSRNEPGQALARLRDTLRTLRQSLREGLGTVEDILDIQGDRVALRPGTVTVDLDLGSVSNREERPRGSEIAADLDGIDPALDEWLRNLRNRYRSSAAGASFTQAAPVVPVATVVPRRGSVIAVSVINAIGPANDEYLPRALAEEIAAALSRIRGLIVVSSTTSAAARSERRGSEVDLGVDFLLEGTIQHNRQRLRVTIKLVDAVSGIVCWTANFDYDESDLFHVQQDVAVLVSAGLEPELPTIAAEHLRRIGHIAGGSYEMLLRAIGRIHLLDRRTFLEAGDLLRQVIDLDPDFSPAYSWYALWHIFFVGQGWAVDPRASTARAGDVAEHAVMLDPNDARGLTIAGHVRAFLHRRLDEAIPLHERALAVNPSLPLAWHLSGVAQAYKGNLLEARYRVEQCRRLAPRDPHSFFADGAAVIIEMLSRNHDQAVTLGRRVTQLHPRFSAAYKPYLAALGHLGLDREAALVYRRLLQLEPDFSVRAFRSTSPFALREHNDHYVVGLQLAGVT